MGEKRKTGSDECVLIANPGVHVSESSEAQACLLEFFRLGKQSNSTALGADQRSQLLDFPVLVETREAQHQQHVRSTVN